jgi:Bacterial DNA topoisomerase IB, N-terminal domain/Eukaryotic DNA topoisomerase I, catalytic core
VQNPGREEQDEDPATPTAPHLRLNCGGGRAFWWGSKSVWLREPKPHPESRRALPVTSGCEDRLQHIEPVAELGSMICANLRRQVKIARAASERQEKAGPLTRGLDGDLPSFLEPSSRRKVHLGETRGRAVVCWSSHPIARKRSSIQGTRPKSAGLRYVSDDRPRIRRKKAGSGFTYTRVDGSRLTERDALKRIKALAIPPAWTDVWICPFADGHIQATGRDAKGRKQYRYHARFREVRESTKYEHVVAFADELPSIREKVREHMGLRGLPREKVLATVVHLLEATLIRVGNDDYAKQNNSYGLTRLKNRHVAVDGNEVRFRFTGKSGKQWSLRVRDRRVAKIIRACQDLPGADPICR